MTIAAPVRLSNPVTAAMLNHDDVSCSQSSLVAQSDAKDSIDTTTMNPV